MTATESHYTAKQLAGLPGMPTSERGVQIMAQRHSWQAVKRSGRGGGKAYSLSCLPAETRQELARQTVNAHLAATPEPVRQATDCIKINAVQAERLRTEARAESLAIFQRLPEWQRRAALAKVEIITACNSYITAAGLATKLGQDLFAHEYNLGHVDIAQWVRAEVPHVSSSSIRKWITAEYQLGSMGLVDCYGNRKGQSKIDTYIDGTDADGNPIKPMAKALLACMIEHPHIKAKHANEYLRASVAGGPWVSDKSVQRWMEAWQKAHPVEWAHIVNPDSAKGTFQPAFGRVGEGITGPNQRWEIDATPADLLLTDGRHKIMGIIDVGTRRKLFYVSKTERAADNLLLVRRALLTWGVPKHGLIVIDNGKPYISNHFLGAMRDLEIDYHICKPFASEEKPFVERAWRHLSHDLIELLPGYCGHNIAERKNIEARNSFAKRLMTKGELIEIKMTATDLQQFLNRWIATDNQRVHSETGKTPQQIVSEWPHPIHTIADERALDVLLSPAAKKGGWATPTKRKGIQVDKIEYYHPHLPQWFGQQVKVYRTDDVGKIVVYGPDSETGVLRFLFVAENPELCGTPRAELAAIARYHHKEIIKTAESLKRQARKELAGKSVGELIQEYREQQAAQNQANVTYFPRPEIRHETPALAAAGHAAAALAGETPAAPLPTADELAAKQRIIDEMERRATSNVRTMEAESDRSRFRRWKGLRDSLAAGEIISEEDYQFYRVFGQSAKCRAFLIVEGEPAAAIK